MSIKKMLLATAVAAFAAMGLAPSAMAGGGEVLHVETGQPIGTEQIRFEGWAKFEDPSDGTGLECHVESDVVTINAETGEVETFDAIGDDTGCTTSGAISHCSVATNGAETTNLPYHLTATPTDFDVEGNIVIDTNLTGFLCPDIELTVESPLTLIPLETGDRLVTGTSGNLGDTAEAGAPLAGVEFTGTGTAHDSFGGERHVDIEGELEVKGDDLCTWELA